MRIKGKTRLNSSPPEPALESESAVRCVRGAHEWHLQAGTDCASSLSANGRSEVDCSGWLLRLIAPVDCSGGRVSRCTCPLGHNTPPTAICCQQATSKLLRGLHLSRTEVLMTAAMLLRSFAPERCQASIAHRIGHAALHSGQRQCFSRICLATETPMKFILQPWQLTLIILANWFNRQQEEVIETLRTENAGRLP